MPETGRKPAESQGTQTFVGRGGDREKMLLKGQEKPRLSNDNHNYHAYSYNTVRNNSTRQPLWSTDDEPGTLTCNLILIRILQGRPHYRPRFHRRES